MNRVVLLSAVVLSLALAADAPCIYKPQVSLSFDLTPLKKMDGDFVIEDRLSAAGIKQKYVMNFCQNVNKIPKDFNGGSSCDKTITDALGNYEDRPVPVFSVVMEEPTDGRPLCARISSPIEVEGSHRFNPYDYTDLARGFCIQYINGDFNVYSKMSSHVCLRCTNDVGIPLQADVIFYRPTAYRIYLDSVFGCPKECYPTADGKLCSNHGVCMYDTLASKTRCVCSQNMKGADCGSSLGISVTEIFVIIDVIAVLVVVGTIIFMGCKLRKLRLNPDAKIDMATQFNTLGTFKA